VPAKPEQGLEEDDEYEQTLSRWQAQVDKVNRRIERDAVEAKSNLAKLKSELVLQNINKGADAADTEESTRKEAERIAQVRKQYLESLNANYKTVKGFDAVLKDKEVEIPVSYLFTEEEKAAYKTKLESFDVDGFIMSRWFNQDGSPNINRLMKDIYFMENEEKVFQKLVNEAGEKRFAHHLKTKSNVNVSGKPDGVFNPQNQKAEAEQAADFFFSN
jgi:hypothetical protein